MQAIDTRFPPALKRVRVPLYPTKAEINFSLLWKSARSSLRSFLAQYYQVQEEQIFLFSRGAIALSFFLRCVGAGIPSMKVALPAFCCPDVCQAILSGGGAPVFLEMGPEFSLLEKSIWFAKAQGCQILVWPHLFGARTISKNTLASIREAGMLFVNDEAQSFPDWGEKTRIQADATLFSFGPSKKLAGMGGGGICIANAKVVSFFTSEAVEENRLSRLSYVKNAFLAKVRLSNPSLASKLGVSSRLERDLRQLLEKFPFFSSPLSPQKIAPLQLQAAYFQLEKYREASEKFLKDLETVKNLCGEIFGIKALRWVEGVLYPSALALDLSQSQKTREEIFRFLSAHGIQATWYYFPLNRLSLLQHYASEPTPFSEEVAAGIIVIPFQWTHSEKNRKILLQSLQLLSRFVE